MIVWLLIVAARRKQTRQLGDRRIGQPPLHARP
jgi:hypothetical protein